MVPDINETMTAIQTDVSALSSSCVLKKDQPIPLWPSDFTWGFQVGLLLPHLLSEGHCTVGWIKARVACERVPFTA